MKILFIVQQLSYGGAERQVVELAKGLHQRGVSVAVAVFYPGNILDDELRDAGVPLFHLEKRGRWDVVGFFFRLIRLMRREKPEILHSYLTVPNLIAGLIKPFVPSVRIIWGIRASNIDLAYYDWLSRLSYRLEALMNSRADMIIVNSEAGCSYLSGNGYPKEKMVFIPNGIDTERFQPDRNAGREVRAAWGFGPEDVVVGLVGRIDPMKGYETFLRAAARFGRCSDLFFVCVGDGPPEYQNELIALSLELGLFDRLVWSEPRNDMPSVYNAFDIFCSSSIFGEGFSNVIGEAMSCGVPCVVTDVGDSARIVGESGIVVPPSDPEALARGFETMIGRLEGEGRDSVVRECIVNRFSRQRFIETTFNALNALS